MLFFCSRYVPFFVGDLANFLTSAEKERIVKHELDSIRALPGDFNIGNLPDAALYADECISKLVQLWDRLTAFFIVYNFTSNCNHFTAS